ncbi:MAG: ABC transporter substrate-binding protein [Anaerovibrio sp.]|uniref:ABC transporter substrate-binding protein n=1 Tax=Anaerovibrio sp. TaxID=1872532 RepID=UPI0025FBF250|nr:ABC transporter substrate-binding protein [Anaerovibrio sp.]MCR5176935.1 ABC transporter substrate-binding protein [Anaerovibrio sp.]
MFFSKKMKLAALGMVAVMSMGLIAGCSNSEQSSKDKKHSIGIVQLVEHDALDAANKGFVDALKERGFEEGKNIIIDNQNAQADQSNLQNIGQRFISNKVDLIYAIATPAAQTVANLTKETPIVGCAITDYEAAKLVKSNNAPGGNVTGTSDMNPIKEQIDLLIKLCPNAKTVGCVYTSSEVNSEIQYKAMKEYAESKGLKVEAATISTVNDIQQAVQSLVNKVDAFYVPTDNVIASAMPTMVSVTSAFKKPVICGESNMVKAGGLATYGVDYYQLGRQAGMMAADILEGKSKPDAMPIQFAKSLKAVVNKTEAEKLGITIPQDVLKDAEVIK